MSFEKNIAKYYYSKYLTLVLPVKSDILSVNYVLLLCERISTASICCLHYIPLNIHSAAAAAQLSSSTFTALMAEM